MAGIDLTQVKQIVITVNCSYGPPGGVPGGGTGGKCSWVATADGRQVGSGVAPDPDAAVDAAEMAMWPDKEKEEHGESPAEEAAEGPAGEEQEGQAAPRQTSAVPTQQQVWQEEARKRTARNAAVNQL